MKRSDRNLGMDRHITRRDLLHGVGAVAATSFAPGQSFADSMLAAETASGSDYPPILTGLRGSHPGSFEVAHQLAREGRVDWGPVTQPDSDTYDLVVVGAGISGLSAAYFFLRDNPGARVLILDNNDDFGGHATRNEFKVGDRTLLAYGGSQSLEEPSAYSDIVNSLLDDLGIDIGGLASGYDQNFYRKNGLAGGVHFDQNNWGSDQLVRYDLGALGGYMPLAPSDQSVADAVQQMPMSDAARAEMLYLLTTTKDHIPDVSADEKEEFLYSLTYREFLDKHIGISEPEVFEALQYLTADSGVGIDKTAAGDALFYSYLPGLKAIGLPDYEDEPYIYHFPDGNASIARMLVRAMMPAVAPGSTMHDVVSALFDYSKLDSEDSAVRLRLNSTVIGVKNDGNPGSAKEVKVTYVRDGRAFQVRARGCVLACYNGMIPALCPELPEAQRTALATQVKTPMLYTNVALSNWHAWKRLGIGAVSSTDGYYVTAMLDFPVSLGEYQFAVGPDDPITVHMERFFHRPNEGLSFQDQRRLGRHDLLSTSFETIERNTRSQLADILAGGGFDPARDIAGITVNRWAHGYADGYDSLDDKYYEDRNDERYPYVIGRKKYGRITIANSDAGASAMLESAIEQAHRAVKELG